MTSAGNVVESLRLGWTRAMLINVAVIGATGYSGHELVRLLAAHPNIKLKVLASHNHVGQCFSDIYPDFHNVVDLCCVDESIEQFAEECDVIFLALPHGLSAQKINRNVIKKTVVIDLGADFRLSSAHIFEKWYELKHPNPNLLENAVYGLSEWNREKIRQSRLIANPGCYATCTLLALLPLVKGKAIKESSIIVDAKSGVSGAGREPSRFTHYNECNETVKAYKLASHRHIPEIEQQLSLHANRPLNITFTPHLVPMNRGILVTAYGSLNDNITYGDIDRVYQQCYSNELFIRLRKKNSMDTHWPETRWVKGTNYCDIGFAVDERTRHVIVVAALDNLVKGAAGQAVQNMNILFGLNELAGLEHQAVFPA